MKVFCVETKNVGDTLSPIIFEHFTGKKAECVGTEEEGKLMMVGSFLEFVRPHDILLGVGSNKPKFVLRDVEATYLSVRGPLTRERISGPEVPEIYGDPALLLPLIYTPEVAKSKRIGIIPHVVDKPLFEGTEYIDIEQDWKKVVDDICSCERVISSTLHGIVLAEAYGVPATWAVYSRNIAGGPFKYQDYFLGTGRAEQFPFTQLPPIPDLPSIQDKLVSLLRSL